MDILCFEGSGADNGWDEERLARPLLAAAEEGDAVTLSRLLRSGPPGLVDVREEPQLSERYSGSWTSGKTPLIKAAQQGHTDVIDALLEAGADVELKDDDAWTALHWAANNGHAAAVRQLLTAGARPAARDAERRSPLTYACIRGHTEAARALLQAGANASAIDRLGKTAVQLAEERGHSDVVQLLRATATNGAAALATTPPTTPIAPCDPDLAYELQRERDAAVARCRELEAELSRLRTRLAAV